MFSREEPTGDEQPGLGQGRMILSGLQFRGHAMFSELDREIGDDTLEYAWLVEVQCGSLIGKMSVPQLYNVLMGLEIMLYLSEVLFFKESPETLSFQDKENVMKHPQPYKVCQHNRRQTECEESLPDAMCPSDEDVKYSMFRLSMDMIDVHLVENPTSLRLQVPKSFGIHLS